MENIDTEQEQPASPPDDVKTIEIDQKHFEEGLGRGRSEFTAETHAALERHCGDRKNAAEDLGITVVALVDRIRNSPDLRARWFSRVDAKCPEAPDDITAMLMEQPITARQERLAEVIKQEDEKLKNGLARLKLTPKEAEMGLAFQNFGRDNFTSLLMMANGSVSRFLLQHASFMDDTIERLKKVRAALNGMEFDNELRGFLMDEEERLMNGYLSGGDLLRKITQMSLDGNKTLALLRHRLKNGNMKRAQKPAFTDVGSSAEVQEENAQNTTAQ